MLRAPALFFFDFLRVFNMATKIVFAKNKKPWLHEMFESLNDHPWAINLNSQIVEFDLPTPDDIVHNEAQLGCKWTVARESSVLSVPA